MTNILFISEDTLKTNTSLDNNIYGKNLLPAIKDAQDIYLQQILGECLYHKILDLVDEGEIEEEEYGAYKILLDDYITDYLCKQVIATLIPVTTSKIANIGTVYATDEHVVTMSSAEVDRLQTYYVEQADFYCRRMQEYLLKNKDNYPELDSCACERLRANLHSAASTTLWLGGARGKKSR